MDRFSGVLYFRPSGKDKLKVTATINDKITIRTLDADRFSEMFGASLEEFISVDSGGDAALVEAVRGVPAATIDDDPDGVVARDFIEVVRAGLGEGAFFFGSTGGYGYPPAFPERYGWRIEKVNGYDTYVPQGTLIGYVGSRNRIATILSTHYPVISNYRRRRFRSGFTLDTATMAQTLHRAGAIKPGGTSDGNESRWGWQIRFSLDG